VAGIAKLLPEMGRPDRSRYKHLSIKDVAQELADSAAGKQPYRLRPEAFFTNDQNLRHGRIQDLFNSVGLTDAWEWMSKHPIMIDYIDNVIGGANTLENELEEFIQARNEAAHGATGSYLGISELEQLSLFAERLGTALVEKARHDMYQYYLTVNQAESLGIVTEIFLRANAVIVQSSGCRFTVGESLGLLTTNCCDFQRVVSCQVDDVDYPSFVAVVGQEIGLRFSQLPRKGAQLVRIVPLVAPEDNLCKHI
jgi:hypothetical protein